MSLSQADSVEAGAGRLLPSTSGVAASRPLSPHAANASATRAAGIIEQRPWGQASAAVPGTFVVSTPRQGRRLTGLGCSAP